MRKSISKFLAVAMATMCVLSVAGCSQPVVGSDDEDSSGKSYLPVFVYNGGFGVEWAYKLEKAFELKYADTEFEPGKKGVNVKINPQKSANVNLSGLLNTSSDEIYFVEKCNIPELVREQLIMDISDIVTDKLTAFEETRSIYDKMDEDAKGWFTNGGKIYGIPHYESYNGITYNVDIWGDPVKGYSLYFAKGGCPSEYTRPAASSFENPEAHDDPLTGSFSSYEYTDLNGEKSAGPDGKYGTLDDGLPATYEEFYHICEYMNESVTPIIWANNFQTYATRGIVGALAADYEGERIKANWDFEGDIEIGVVDGDSVSSQIVTIDNSTGYQVYNQMGKYHALTFMEQLIDNDWTADACFSGKVTNQTAQNYFLYSGVVPGAEKIAMISEGVYWMEEASATSETLADDYGVDSSNRKFAFMPLPKVSAEYIGTEKTLVDGLASACVVSKKVDSAKMDLIKTFIQFSHTDVELNNFTKYTDTAKGLDYQISSDVYDELSYYGKSIIDYRKSANVYHAYSDNPIIKNYFFSFFYGETENFYYSNVGGDKANPHQ